MQKIKDEVNVLESIGGSPKLVNKIDLPFEIKIGIEMQNQAQFHPLKYLYKIAEVLKEYNVQIYTNSRVQDVKRDGSYYNVKTENNNIKAKYVVIATKYPIINFPGLYFLKMYQSTSNAIVVDPKADLFDGMYINSEAPTISLRTIQNGEKRLLLVAGFDHKTGAEIDLQDSYNYLEKVAKSMYPKCEVLYRWNTEDTKQST